MNKRNWFWGWALGLAVLILPDMSLARENPTDWYVKDFQTEIQVKEDSTLEIVETIVADAAKLPDKHGIFRVLPETINVEGKKVHTPVELVSITNERGVRWQNEESRSAKDGTVTWKIGNPNVNVLGVNTFVIRYKVGNAISFVNPNFDELYWNLSGNFWQMDIEKFQAKIVFPPSITQDKTAVTLYAGKLGAKDSENAFYKWSAPNVLQVQARSMLNPGEGVTASVTLPKNVFVPYKLGIWQIYGAYVFYAIPVIIFLVCFLLWWKFGKDPKLNKTVIAQYEIPENLSPLTMGELMQSGSLKKESIAAELVNFAVQGFVKIRETETKVLFVKSKDYEFEYTGKDTADLSLAQKQLLDEIFDASSNVKKLSELKRQFQGAMAKIEKQAFAEMVGRDFLSPKGKRFGMIFIAVGVFTLFVSIGLRRYIPDEPFWSIIISGIVFILFACVMPKRTARGAEVNWQIKGFKLFLKTVDKDRAVFYEKENIFEKFLPYAILFGMTKQWIERMREVYGEEFMTRYVPAWYVGSLAGFDANSFAGDLDQLSKSIAMNMASSSGAGGAGGSGGGRGGGGGGGW